MERDSIESTKNKYVNEETLNRTLVMQARIRRAILGKNRRCTLDTYIRPPASI